MNPLMMMIIIIINSQDIASGVIKIQENHLAAGPHWGSQCSPRPIDDGKGAGCPPRTPHCSPAGLASPPRFISCFLGLGVLE